MPKPKQNPFHGRVFIQMVRTMKITAIILLTACLQVSATGHSQTVTLSEKEAPLLNVFKAIEKQSDYVFFYKLEWLQEARKVTIEVKGMPLQEVLELLFKKQPLTYSIVGKNIIINFKNDALTKKKDTIQALYLIDIRGRVFNENSDPVPGVTVTIKGSNTKTVTDANGEFALSSVEQNAVLVFTHVSMDAFELKISGKKELFVKLKAKVNALDEVQVIAYGTTTKRLNTGNITSVKAVDIEKQPVNNPLLALQGRVPGLIVTQSTGLPGSGISVRIQGQNTIGFNIGNDPLYLIDGVPYPSRLLSTLSQIQGSSGDNVPDMAGGQVGTGNPLSFINPADIESIDILKDADATAIYGSRAANGAVLITTKKGKVGQAKVDINMQSGWGKITRKLDLLNTHQYLQMRHEAYSNDGTSPSPTQYDINGRWDTTRYTDWQKILIGGTTRVSDVQARISGGNINTQFLVGAGYHRETTVFPGDLADRKGSIHFNLNSLSHNQKLRLQLSGSYMIDNNQLINRDLTFEAINLAPVAPPLYNVDGSLNWAPLANGNSTWSNPLAYLENEYVQKANNLVSNAIISYQIIPGLDIKSSFGYTNLQLNETQIFPLSSFRPEIRPNTLRRSQFSNNNMNSWIIEPQASYKLLIGKGKLDALVGSTFQENKCSLEQLFGSGYNSDLVLKDLSSAPTKSVFTGTSTYRYNAIFGRITYNWQDKYILNLTTRRDGSSRFGSKNQFHNFGSAGAAWIFSNESSIKKHLAFLSFGKLRASYGSTGNDQIGDYQFLSLYNTISPLVPYQGATGLEPTNLPNPYLAWEETRKLQFGLELGLFNDKIFFNTNYYRNRSSNQLLPYALPILAGFEGITTNFPAIVQNSGWEFSINTMNVTTRDFSWTSNINLTIPKNKLLEFPDLETSSYGTQLIIGQPITIVNIYHSLGVDPATGVYQFNDGKGNPTSNPDTSYLISRNPLNTSMTLYGGFQNTIRFHGFELDMLFQFAKQKGENYFVGNRPGFFSGSSNLGNQPVSVLERWQKPGDNTNVQRFSANNSIRLQHIFATQSNLSNSDASYIRLKNVSLFWNMPEKWRQKIHLQSAKLYIQCQNLLTITNYTGLDPETRSSITLPPLRMVTVGLRLIL